MGVRASHGHQVKTHPPLSHDWTWLWAIPLPWDLFHFLSKPGCGFSAFSLQFLSLVLTRQKKHCRCWTAFPGWHETCRGTPKGEQSCRGTSKGERKLGLIFHLLICGLTPSKQPLWLTKDRWPEHWPGTLISEIPSLCHIPHCLDQRWWVTAPGRFYLPSGFVIILLSHSLVHLVEPWVFPSTQ